MHYFGRTERELKILSQLITDYRMSGEILNIVLFAAYFPYEHVWEL